MFLNTWLFELKRLQIFEIKTARCHRGIKLLSFWLWKIEKYFAETFKKCELKLSLDSKLENGKNLTEM